MNDSHEGCDVFFAHGCNFAFVVVIIPPYLHSILLLREKRTHYCCKSDIKVRLLLAQRFLKCSSVINVLKS